MVGLVTDTGILLIEYGKLKRGVDAAAISAAQQYRLSGTVLDQVALENAAKNFLQLNQATNILSVTVHSCEDLIVSDRPALCNPDPVGQPNDNRKLVEVAATKAVRFGFLRVIGIQSTTLSASSVGEAATIDLVMIIDTSASMAYETDPLGNPISSDPGDDPHACNLIDTCQPLRAVKDVALDFIDTLYFPYDRVSIITMTGQQTPFNGTRGPVEVLALNSDKATITAAIDGLKVFEPRMCDGSDTEGSCLNYDGGGTFIASICQIYENHSTEAAADPSSCPSSNVGGVLNAARGAFTEDPASTRLDAFWVVVTLLGGPANSTDVNVSYPNGFCPPNTFLLTQGQGPWCRDRFPSVRHADTDALVSYTNPIDSSVTDISLYDADDYARDMADDLATLTSGDGVTIFTIGLGAQIRNSCTSSELSAGGYECNGDGILKVPAAETLLQYIAECAGDSCGNTINHGQYFYAPTSTSLADIFDRIAKNIATRISQ
jgi:hypothetical protein